MINLPRETLNIIFSYLSDEDKKNLRFTCNLFYETIGKDPSIIIMPLLNRLKAIDKHVSLIPPADTAKNPKWAMERFVAEFNRIAALQNQEILHFRDYRSHDHYTSDILKCLNTINHKPATTLKELEEREDMLEEINAKLIDLAIDRNYPPRLNISNLGLTRFPERIFKMHPPAFWSTLTEMSCCGYEDRWSEGNKLKTLPESLAEHCPMLQHLYCYGNEISTLPNSLATCANLQNLICHNNYLTAKGIPTALINKLGTQWQQTTLADQKQQPTLIRNMQNKTKETFKSPEAFINRLLLLIDSYLPRFSESGKTFYCLTHAFDLNATKDFDSLVKALEQNAFRYPTESPFYQDIIFYPSGDEIKAQDDAHKFTQSCGKAAYIIQLKLNHLLTKKAQQSIEGRSQASVLWEDENVTHWSIKKIEYNATPPCPAWSQGIVASKSNMWKNFPKALLSTASFVGSTLVGAAALYAGLGLGTAMSAFFASSMLIRSTQYLRNKIASGAFFEFMPNLNKTATDFEFETIKSQKGSVKTYFDLGKEAQNSWNAYVKSACYQTYLPTKHGRAFQAGRKAQEILNRTKIKNKL
ncbi:MAG: hypothetical protein JSS07_09880 [Proteobacteria bacterium]|nr:hypothetical protein [Pseudomonadota bacterium]